MLAIVRRGGLRWNAAVNGHGARMRNAVFEFHPEVTLASGCWSPNANLGPVTTQ
jgi:hypothetical protein